MLRRRFSIGNMLALIAILGVALAALRSPSYLWANAAFTAALAAVVAAVVNTVFGRGARRAYWFGFAIFGGTYLAICSTPGLRESVCPRLVTEALLDVLYPFMAPDVPQPPPPITVTAMINGGPVLLSSAPGVANPAAATPAFAVPEIASVASGPMQTSPPSRPVAALPRMWVLPPASPPGGLAAWTAPDRSIGVGYRIGSIALGSSEAFRQIGHSLMALLVATIGGVFARNRYDVYARAGQHSEPA
jgi:hypothetical protein